MDADRNARLFKRLVLLVGFLALFARLIGFVVRFGNESLQMDLAAYYTAGLSAQGLLDGKYVVGQLLCLAGLLGLWRREAPQRTTRGSTPVT